MWFFIACTDDDESRESAAPVDTDTHSEEEVVDLTQCGWETWNQDKIAYTYEAVIAGTADACERGYYLKLLDDRSVGAGPWLENLYMVYTPDGESFDFTRKIDLYTSAAVPDCVRGDDGRYYLFFGEGSLERAEEIISSSDDWQMTHGLLGWGALDLAVSDDGINFERVEEWGIEGLTRGLVVDPEIHRLPDGTWRMYYIATPVPELVQEGSWADGVDHRLYYAESTDLIHWKQVQEAVYGPNADPAIHCDGDYCMVVSTGADWSYSTDGGQTFTFYELTDPFGFAPNFFELPDGRLRLYYNSRVKGGALESWISSDGGDTWEEEGERVPVRTVEAVTFCEVDEGGYYMYYHYWEDGYSGDNWDTSVVEDSAG